MLQVLLVCVCGFAGAQLPCLSLLFCSFAPFATLLVVCKEVAHFSPSAIQVAALPVAQRSGSRAKLQVAYLWPIAAVCEATLRLTIHSCNERSAPCRRPSPALAHAPFPPAILVPLVPTSLRKISPRSPSPPCAPCRWKSLDCT